MKDDFSNDKDFSSWLPEEGWHEVKIESMIAGESKKGNPKYTIDISSVADEGSGITIDVTNLQGKRWLLRQLIEACKPNLQTGADGKKIYDWEISDIVGKTVTAHIVHDKTPFINREGKEQVIPKAKFIGFRSTPF